MTQSIRQVARRKALDAQAKLRRDRADTERRRSALAVEVAVALTERDAAIERYELAAAMAVGKMLDDEGLSLSEVCVWAGGVSLSEVKRLQKLAGRTVRN